MNVNQLKQLIAEDTDDITLAMSMYVHPFVENYETAAMLRDLAKTHTLFNLKRLDFIIEISAALIQHGGEYLNPDYLLAEATKIVDKIISDI